MLQGSLSDARQAAAGPAGGVVYATRFRIPSFELLRPRTTDDLAGLYGSARSWTYMAGGIDLKAALKAGFRVDLLVDLKRLERARAIDRDDQDGLRIGSCVSHAELIASELVQQELPDVPSIWMALGNRRVRAVGTLGGNMLADAGKYFATPVLAALSADVEVFDGSSTTSLPVEQATLDRIREAQLLLLAVRVPHPGTSRIRLVTDFATARVAAALHRASEELVVSVNRKAGLVVQRFPLADLGDDRRELRDAIAAIAPPVVEAEASAFPHGAPTGLDRWVERVLEHRLGALLKAHA